ncbi:MAG TPA: transferrin receptor-like dimerization domain-containing protein, partial [Puia sp.]|nr:transferrin receptor-like dimerization domain-containing protein [Puia sp.]
RESTAINNEILKNNYSKLAADTAKPFVPAEPKEAVPPLDFTPLRQTLPVLATAIAKAQSDWMNALSTGKQADELNQKLYRAEQQLLLDSGLPLRPWYKHVLYAPGMYTGYGVKTMPGIREAIEQRNFHEAEVQIGKARDALMKFAAYLQTI